MTLAAYAAGVSVVSFLYPSKLNNLWIGFAIHELGLDLLIPNFQRRWISENKTLPDVQINGRFR